MQSQGSTSTQPSFDTLSSSDSSLFSDSTEDDTDVFLSERSPSVIIGGPHAPRNVGPGRLESPAAQWTYDDFADREEEESGRSASCKGRHLGVEGSEKSREEEKSQADLLFAKKCAELQGFVRPLLELLNGLKGGRFERGLTSFQQSVAIDRIQRIVGVLRRPNGGEKYLDILTQVEKMLKVWFPHVAPLTAPPLSSSLSSSSSSSIFSAGTGVCSGETPSTTPAHRHADQMHMPVKKRRLSWTESDYSTPPPVLRKRLHPSRGEERGKQEGVKGETLPSSGASEPAPMPLDLSSTLQPEKETETDEESQGNGEPSGHSGGPYSEPSLMRVHASPTFSDPKSCSPHKGAAADPKGTQLVSAVPPPTSRGSPIMQDSSISSTTPYKDPKNQGKPLQSRSGQHVARQQPESATTLETIRGPSQSPPVTVQPLTGATPIALET